MLTAIFIHGDSYSYKHSRAKTVQETLRFIILRFTNYLLDLSYRNNVYE